MPRGGMEDERCLVRLLSPARLRLSRPTRSARAEWSSCVPLNKALKTCSTSGIFASSTSWLLVQMNGFDLNFLLLVFCQQVRSLSHVLGDNYGHSWRGCMKGCQGRTDYSALFEEFLEDTASQARRLPSELERLERIIEMD